MILKDLMEGGGGLRIVDSGRVEDGQWPSPDPAH
jgi:hypothetical protein